MESPRVHMEVFFFLLRELSVRIIGPFELRHFPGLVLLLWQ